MLAIRNLPSRSEAFPSEVPGRKTFAPIRISFESESVTVPVRIPWLKRIDGKMKRINEIRRTTLRMFIAEPSRGRTESGNLIGNFTATMMRRTTLYVKEKTLKRRENANDSYFTM